MKIAASIRAACCAAILALLLPARAEAQIYAWRDAAGNLVLSDKKKDENAATYSVASAAASTGFRTTKPLSPRASEFTALIEEHAALNHVSPDLVRAVIQAESAFNPGARSPKGAMGLMQLMPATAAELGVTDPYDPAQNIRGGVAYLKHLLDTYDGRVELALAAYNAGPGAVKKYGFTVPPYRETREYVAKIRKRTEEAADAAGTAGTLPGPGERTRVYRTVEIVDGREVVRYTGTPREGSERVKTAERR